MECNFENCPNFERLGKKFADRILELERENAELKAYKDVNEDFKTAWEELKAENERLKEEIKEYKKHSKCAWKCFEGTLCEEGEKYKACLQEIKGVVTALHMNNWLQMNETARKSIQLLQELITKAEEE